MGCNRNYEELDTCPKNRLAAVGLEDYLKTYKSVDLPKATKMLVTLLCESFKDVTNSDNPSSIADCVINNFITN